MRPSPVGSSTSAVRTVSTLPAGAVRLDEGGHRRGAQQRGVAVDQQHRARRGRGRRRARRRRRARSRSARAGRRAARRARSAPGAPRPRPGPTPTTTTVAAAWSGSAAASTWPSRLRPPRVCSTLGVDDRIRVPCPAARTTTAAIIGDEDGDVSCGLTDLLGRRQVVLRWGTRTRTETARLQRPAGCRLPHPPPAARVATQAPPRDDARPGA